MTGEIRLVDNDRLSMTVERTNLGFGNSIAVRFFGQEDIFSIDRR